MVSSHSALPTGSAGRTGRLRWNPAVAVLGAGGRVLLLGRDGFRLFETHAWQLLDGLPLDRIGPDLARRLLGPAGTPANLRASLDRLLARGWLQLRLEEPGAAYPRRRASGAAETNSELADRK